MSLLLLAYKDDVALPFQEENDSQLARQLCMLAKLLGFSPTCCVRLVKMHVIEWVDGYATMRYFCRHGYRHRLPTDRSLFPLVLAQLLSPRRSTWLLMQTKLSGQFFHLFSSSSSSRSFYTYYGKTMTAPGSWSSGCPTRGRCILLLETSSGHSSPLPLAGAFLGDQLVDQFYLVHQTAAAIQTVYYTTIDDKEAVAIFWNDNKIGSLYKSVGRQFSSSNET